MGRAKWKGPFFQKSIQILYKKKIIEVINKNADIVKSLINKTFKVHTGKKYLKVLLSEKMLGHKIGEFVLTRAKYIFIKKKKKR